MLARSLQSHNGITRQATHMTTTPETATPDERPCDVTRRFIRITKLRADDLVCFEFAIGWPELFVELMLPRAAFDDFCIRQKVHLLTD